MNPTPDAILHYIQNRELNAVLRGEAAVFRTPPEINGDMLPTDHSQFLEFGLYPLVQSIGADGLARMLEAALSSIAHDALGVFCSIQCFYIQILNEKSNRSPIHIDRTHLPKIIYSAFLRYENDLHQLSFRKKDLAEDRNYRVTLAAIQALQKDHGIQWQ